MYIFGLVNGGSCIPASEFCFLVPFMIEERAGAVKFRVQRRAFDMIYDGWIGWK
jgi:hypothetical protein